MSDIKNISIENNTAEPVRVAQIIGKMWAGGVEAAVFNYYRYIDKTQVQFDFFYDEDSTIEPPQDLIDMGARFYRLPPYQHLFSYLRSLRQILRKNQYQIIHSHLNTLSVFPLYAGWREKIPVRIAHNHSVPGGNELKRDLAKIILKKGAKLFPTDYFACSEKAGRWLFGDRQFDQGKVLVIKNAIDYDRFHPDEKLRALIREEYALNRKTVVGHVGRFTFAKNHKLLIDAFAEYHKQNSDSVLMLVGDGELRVDIEKQIQDRHIQDCCVLVGKTGHTERFYRAMDVVVMPSLFEGLGMAAVEGQACKVPVIISKAIPQEAIISDGVQYVEAKENPAEWAEAIEQSVQKTVNYTQAYHDYDVHTAGKRLTKWYIDRIKNL